MQAGDAADRREIFPHPPLSVFAHSPGVLGIFHDTDDSHRDGDDITAIHDESRLSVSDRIAITHGYTSDVRFMGSCLQENRWTTLCISIFQLAVGHDEQLTVIEKGSKYVRLGCNR